MVLFSLVVSSLFLGWVWYVSRSPNGAARAARVACVQGVLGFFLISGIFLLQGFLMLLAALTCMASGSRGKPVITSAVAMTIVAYVLGFLTVLPDVVKLERLRKAYPVTSLAERLAYESRNSDPTDEGAVGLLATPVALRRELQYELQDQNEAVEQSSHYERRNSRLERLHSATARNFIFAVGFGAGRMVAIRPTYLQLPESTPAVPQPTPQKLTNDYAFGGEPVPQPEPTATDFENLHRNSRLEFLSAERWGFVKSREHTVGFESHRFRAVPPLRRLDKIDHRWQTARIELVSLLRQPEPRVYVSENLPQMDELRDAPTRPADDFERSAVERLRTEEDVVAHPETNVIRMLGSIRASEACLTCHTARRGELLGAFSYELLRVNPLPEPQPKPTGVPLTLR